MTVLLDLDAPNKSSPFGVFAENDSDVVDAAAPLEGRWIRFWPWPYGPQRKNVHLDETSDRSSEMRNIRKRDLAESTRLLYVGATRARDYLVLGCNTNTDWLDTLTDAFGKSLLQLPRLEGEHSLQVAGSEHRVLVVRADDASTVLSPSKERLDVFETTPAQEAVFYPPYLCQPSSLRVQQSDQGLNPSLMRVHRLGPRLSLIGKPDMTALGELFHAFLAADTGLLGNADERLDLAVRLIRNWNVTCLEPGELIEAGNRLERFVFENFSEPRLSKECPVVGKINNQVIRGRVDLCIEALDGIVIVDHKTFPGAYDTWFDRAAEYTPQLATYGEIASRSLCRPVTHLLVHLPVVGAVVDVTRLV